MHWHRWRRRGQHGLWTIWILWVETSTTKYGWTSQQFHLHGIPFTSSGRGCSPTTNITLLLGFSAYRWALYGPCVLHQNCSFCSLDTFYTPSCSNLMYRSTIVVWTGCNQRLCSSACSGAETSWLIHQETNVECSISNTCIQTKQVLPLSTFFSWFPCVCASTSSLTISIFPKCMWIQKCYVFQASVGDSLMKESVSINPILSCITWQVWNLQLQLLQNLGTVLDILKITNLLTYVWFWCFDLW